MSTAFRPETIALHGGQEPDPATGARAVPIYQTSSYVFRDSEHAAALFALKEQGYIYSRIMNPTNAVFEARVAALEGGSGALAVSSGQSAAAVALLTILKAGDGLLAASTLYGGTYTLFRYTFPKMGIRIHFADPAQPDEFRRILREDPSIKAVYAESLGNPNLSTLDFEEFAAVAHEAGIPLVVDNTIPSPYLLRPFDYGADIVIHSATKFIGGHGTSIAGIIVDGGRFNWANGRFPDFTEPDPSYHGLRFWDAFGDVNGSNVAFITKARVQTLRDLGPALSPSNSFLLLQGLETLHLRMQRHSENALAVASFLEGHRLVAWVNYPGLPNDPTHATARKYFKRGLYSAIVGFGVKGGREAGRKVIQSVRLFSHLANIGDAKSLIIHPASTTHQQLSPAEQASAGVTDDFIRLSVGLEHLDDIIEDLDNALEASRSS